MFCSTIMLGNKARFAQQVYLIFSNKWYSFHYYIFINRVFIFYIIDYTLFQDLLCSSRAIYTIQDLPWLEICVDFLVMFLSSHILVRLHKYFKTVSATVSNLYSKCGLCWMFMARQWCWYPSHEASVGSFRQRRCEFLQRTTANN